MKTGDIINGCEVVNVIQAAYDADIEIRVFRTPAGTYNIIAHDAVCECSVTNRVKLTDADMPEVLVKFVAGTISI